ncbi:MAG: DUF6691 family protein [Planctomycetota bacterium]|jgi:uncharacterized membrane protein YedE/YeeE
MTRLVVIFVGGLLFGFGLAVSNMVEQEVVLGFVQLRDLGLGVTMAGALVITMPIYQLVSRLRRRPPLGAEFEQFPRRVAAKNVLGGVIFGIGWGLSGVCPGSAIASIGVGNWPILAAIAGMLLGAYLQGALMPTSAAAPATPSG